MVEQMPEKTIAGPMLDARALTLSIACPLPRAYDFAHRPENFPKWAAGLSDTLRRDGDNWIADTPAGRAEIRFSARNDHGVLDHSVHLPGGPPVAVPFRMVANGGGTEVIFILFRQPGMDDAAWDHDATLVRRDLAALKALLEAEPEMELGAG